MLTQQLLYDAILNDKGALEAVSKAVGRAPSELEGFLLGKPPVKCDEGAVAFLKINIDGGSRGNPGEAGCGVVVNSGTRIAGYYYYLGNQTNNFAEYKALEYALLLSKEIGAKSVTVYSDSELVCKQITGIYKVKNGNIAGLYNSCIKLISSINNFKIEHVRREFNKEADKLANIAMDKRENGKTELTVAF